MKNEEIKKAVSEIDDKFITEADPLTTKRYGSLLWRKRLQAGLTAAAVVAVAVLGGVTWRQSQIQKTSDPTTAPIVAYQDKETSGVNDTTTTDDGSDTSVGASDSGSNQDNNNDALAASGTVEDKDDSESQPDASGNDGNASAGKDGKTDNAASNSNTGNSSNASGSGNSESQKPAEDVTVASAADLAAIGPYDRAESYGDVYDKLCKRYSHRYALTDEAFNEESDAVAKGDMAESAPAAEPNASMSADSADSDGSTSGAGSDDYSTTNVMHEGVDEGDIAKTDGKYIYLLESDCISITDIRNGKPGKKTMIVPDNKNALYWYQEMYVHGDTLVIVATEYSNNKYNTIYDYDVDDDWIDFGYYNYYNNDTTNTIALCYDISDRTQAKYKGKVTQSGYYNTSRLIGDKFYLFSNKDMFRPLDMSKKKALKDVTTFIPCVNDEPVDYGDIYIKDQYSSATVIASFDIDDCENIIDTKAVVNGYGQVYVSDTSIYFYETDYTGDDYTEVTNIGKITLNNGNMIPSGSAAVKGYIPDQFAIHEINGNLMVLTTAFVKYTTTNNLFMLDSSLDQIGKISGIAKDEYIYAARYLGDYVYFITYRSIDPLFVADISDPYNPKLLGEVEIEGYSDYLHIWDKDHVLGLGYETVDNGYGGEKREGIKLVMFDVSDPLNPVIENTLVLKDEDYSYAISYLYKALLVSPGKNLIGFDTVDYDRDYDDWTTYYLFSYSKEKGFKVELESSLEGYGYDEYRGLYSGDNFYLVRPSAGVIDHYKLKK